MRSTRRVFAPWLVLCGILLSLTACVDDSQAPPSRAEPTPELLSTDEPGNLAPLDLVYVCGNKFLATNSFRRTVELPLEVDAEKAEAVHRNGVLLLRIPKAPEHKPRRIAVQPS